MKNFSICITTFKYRFEKYLKNLINEIRNIDNDIEIILCINGEYGEEFDEEYRKNLLNFISSKNNIYPIFFPKFRGLSKLWNTGVIHSSNDYILMLNDDVSIIDSNFLNNVQKAINERQSTFKINWTFSHVVFKKEEYVDLGGVSEMLLFLGEEDGYLNWWYEKKYGAQIQSENIQGIINHVDMTNSPKGISTLPQGKYSQYNNYIMYNVLFNIDHINGEQHGMCPQRLKPNIDLISQFPSEKFYLNNKNNVF